MERTCVASASRVDVLGLLGVMNHHLWVNSGHISVRPGEAIMMLLKEVDEALAEVLLHMSSNLNLVVR